MEHLLQQLDNLEQSLAHSFVSILIFMEHLLQLFLNIKVGFFLIVSILIFMEHLLQLFLNIKVGFFLIVSILIFMEHLLQPGKT